MLLVVAIVGGAVFSIVQGQETESITGLDTRDFNVDNFGSTTKNTVQFDIRNPGTQSLTIQSVRIEDSEGNNRTVNVSERIDVGENSLVEVWGFRPSDQVNEYNIEVVYDSGKLNKQYDAGSLNIRSELVPKLDEYGSWVSSKGSEELGTEKGFYVMQYEAKPYDADADFLVEGGSTGTDYWGYEGVEPRSWAEGEPWINSSYNADGDQTNMKEACQLLDEKTPNYDIGVMTNAQFMTLAREAETNKANWQNEEVGGLKEDNKGIYSGNTNISTNTDCNPAEGPVNATGQNANSCERDGSQLRSMELDSGNHIWDLSGNVWETVKVGDKETVDAYSCEASNDLEFHNFSGSATGTTEACDFIDPYTGYNSTEDVESGVYQLGSAEGFNSSHGIGSIQSMSGSADAVLRRGGSWDLGELAGIMASSTVHEPWAVDSNTGFRCSATIS